jgi:hypothetical protein
MLAGIMLSMIGYLGRDVLQMVLQPVSECMVGQNIIQLQLEVTECFAQDFGLSLMSVI